MHVGIAQTPYSIQITELFNGARLSILNNVHVGDIWSRTLFTCACLIAATGIDAVGACGGGGLAAGGGTGCAAGFGGGGAAALGDAFGGDGGGDGGAAAAAAAGFGFSVAGAEAAPPVAPMSIVHNFCPGFTVSPS